MDFLIKSAAHIPGIIEKIKRVLQSWSAFPGKRKGQSGALQSPDEPLLPVALCLGLLRARPKLQQWVDQWTWEEIRQFATTKAFRFDAWSATIGTTAYADVARALVETVSSMMASDERHLLGGLHERMEKRVSPASLASKAVRSSRKDFLELVKCPSSFRIFSP
ncbi:MAG: hypothetical protein WCQ57_09965 [Verrucomicrobiota bacterium]